jgi:hypothetical protein
LVCISNNIFSKISDGFLEEKIVESTSDAKIYNEMTTIIPPESISIPLILHGILEQVEAQTENNNNVSNQPDEVGRYLNDKLNSLSVGKEQQKVRKQRNSFLNIFNYFI